MSRVKQPSAIDAKHCPFCGSDNRCGASSATPCWCFDTAVPAALLELLPDQQRGKACVCFSCIQNFNRDPEDFAEQWSAD